MSTERRHRRESDWAVAPVGGRSEVQAFLARIARTLTAGDGKTVAGMWAVPALVLGDDDVRAIGSLAELGQFLGGVKEQHSATYVLRRDDVGALKVQVVLMQGASPGA
jgi:hypothetical protein